MPAYGIRHLDFTIASGASLSAGLNLNGMHGESIVMPAAWTAAGLSFSVSDTLGGTYLPLIDALGVEVTLTVAAAKSVVLPLGLLRAHNFLKLKSGTSAAPVNQAADRAVQLLVRSFAG